MQRAAVHNRPRRPEPSERGSSLIEVLVAMTIMSVLLMGIVAGYFTSVEASSKVGANARTDSALTAMSETAASMPYRPCGTLTTVRADFDALPRPAGFTASLTGVRYLTASGSGFATTCATDRGAQMLVLEVRSTAPGSAAKSARIVIRDPTVRAA